MKRVELNIHSGYSLLKSSIQLETLFETLQAYHIDTFGITDYNTTSAFIKIEQLAQKYHIKALYGSELYLYDHDSYLTIYTKDQEGYPILNRLVTISATHKGIKLSDFNDLTPEDRRHLIAIIGGHHVLIDYITQKETCLAEAMMDIYQKLFPYLYLGIGITTQIERVYQDALVNFATSHHIIPIAFNSVHYLKKEDYEDYLFIRSVEGGHYPAQVTEREKFSYLLTDEDLERGYQLHPELIKNACSLAENYQVKICSGEYHFPRLKATQEDSNRYLVDLCKYGLNKRLKDKCVSKDQMGQYRERLLYELGIITKMGFADYFLIVQDFVCWAKKQGYRVGLGRGSAPSSLVVYSLGISDVDPLEYNLLFERFLNPGRISMPDIDVDIQDNHRNDVVNYLVSKYGPDQVCEIKAFQTFGVKAIIQEVGRLREIDAATLKEISKYAPTSLEKVETFTENVNVIKLSKAYPAIQYIVDRVNHLYDLPKAITTHAPGVVMTDQPLLTYTALEPGSRSIHQSQYDKEDLEALGLVKMDILSISNLTMIQDILDAIKKDYPDFDVDHIPLNDRLTYQLMASGDTDDIFQFDSDGMKRLLRRMKVSQFMDLVEANALFRPGPAVMIDTFIKRKNHELPVEYPHPSLANILKDTYGVIVFQEQVMLIACEFAGYTLGEADVLRAAMSHKKEDVIKREESHFIQGAIEKGHSTEEASHVYQYFLAFASYGFNKSHSVCYALIGYQMAYLKAHFSAYFGAYMLSKSLKSDKITAQYLQFLRNHHISLVAPDINVSTQNFEIREGHVYYALSSIRDLNSMMVENILTERDKGLFTTYEDFLKRTRSCLSKESVMALIDSGALDSLNESHKGMHDIYETLINRLQFSALYEEKELVTLNIPKDEYNFGELSQREKEQLGVNIKYNAFVLLADKRQQYNTTSISQLKMDSYANVIFEITECDEITTKKGDIMAFFKAYDESGEIEGTIFSKDYQNFKPILADHKIIVGRGRCENRDGKLQFILREIYFYA